MVDSFFLKLIQLLSCPCVPLYHPNSTAFTKSCERMGHGKGFYDTFLVHYAAKAIEEEKQLPIKVVCCCIWMFLGIGGGLG